MEISDFDDAFTTFETAFNVAGSLPLIATVSGALRVAAAKVQFFTGVVFGITGLIGQCAASNPRKWENVTHVGVENIKHGALNVIRGIAEGILGITIVGSLFLFVAQLIMPNGFTPIFKYHMAQQPQPVRAY